MTNFSSIEKFIGKLCPSLAKDKATTNKKETEQLLKKEICSRCNRAGHCCRDCFCITDKNGKQISDE